MSTKLKRFTVIVTPEIERGLKDLKREVYYDRSQSDMARDLLRAGLRAAKEEHVEKAQSHRVERYAYNENA